MSKSDSQLKEEQNSPKSLSSASVEPCENCVVKVCTSPTKPSQRNEPGHTSQSEDTASSSADSVLKDISGVAQNDEIPVDSKLDSNKVKNLAQPEQMSSSLSSTGSDSVHLSPKNILSKSKRQKQLTIVESIANGDSTEKLGEFVRQSSEGKGVVVRRHLAGRQSRPHSIATSSLESYASVMREISDSFYTARISRDLDDESFSGAEFLRDGLHRNSDHGSTDASVSNKQLPLQDRTRVLPDLQGISKLEVRMFK